jgi:chaperonin cofactor prefoldin
VQIRPSAELCCYLNRVSVFSFELVRYCQLKFSKCFYYKFTKMSGTCGVCNVYLRAGKTSEVVTCSGSCKKSFHINCIKDDTEEAKVRSVKHWRCKDCRDGGNSNSIISDSSAPITKEFIRTVLEGFRNDMFGELKTVKDEMTEVVKSIGFLSDKVDASNTLMEELKKNINDLKKENDSLRATNSSLCESVNDLQDRVRSLEQYTRRSNIEISGVPATPNENVVKLVKDVGRAIGASVDEAQINAAHRVPSFRNDRAPSLVVQFNSRSVRDDWIKHYKENRNATTADKINASFPKSKVFVNEHLAPVNKVFLSKLKKKCREIGYTYVWFREGKFFVRKCNGEKCIRIVSDADIEKLK